jgi:hypothetical protein
MTFRKATSKKKAQPTAAPPKASAPIAWGKAVHETFVEFFADPPRDKLRVVLKDVAGEMRQLDFKAEWPKAGPMAKHILAMGNSGGGCLVIGAEEKADKASGVFGAAFAEPFSGVFGALAGASEPNPNYPAEGFEAFVASLIVKKKRRIAEEIDVPFG